jgi:hypothetical protein
MKKIYIAGKVSGECETPELMRKCIEKFNRYAENLTFGTLKKKGLYLVCENLKITYGLIINEDIIPNGTWEDYMKEDIREMLLCDEIHFLDDWRYSTGAKIEHDLAEKMKMKIVYQKTTT